MRLFIQWAWKQYGEAIFIFTGGIGFFLGIPVVIVELVPSLEGYRFGWFYDLVHIPSPICLAIFITIMAFAIADALVSWGKTQIESWKSYKARHS